MIDWHTLIINSYYHLNDNAKINSTENWVSQFHDEEHYGNFPSRDLTDPGLSRTIYCLLLCTHKAPGGSTCIIDEVMFLGIIKNQVVLKEMMRVCLFGKECDTKGTHVTYHIYIYLYIGTFSFIYFLVSSAIFWASLTVFYWMLFGSVRENCRI